MLKHFPSKYIHEPWTAPESVQVAARCVVGRDYPLPMVNHQDASHVNLQRIRQVYQQLTQCAKAPGKLLFSLSTNYPRDRRCRISRHIRLVTTYADLQRCGGGEGTTDHSHSTEDGRRCRLS